MHILRQSTRIFALLYLFSLSPLSLDGQTGPAFSKEHGFFETPFNLAITASDPGVEVYFTIDGSTPGIKNGTLYKSPLNIAGTTILRAVCIKNNLPVGSITTRTYIFLNDVIHQSNTPQGYPTSWGPYTGISGTAIADYEMDPDLMADPQFEASVKEALLDLPTISIVTDKGYFFNKSQNPDTGGIYIYTGPPLTNTTNGIGFGWERPASVEYFDSRDSVSFQVNCGVRIQGGHSRRPEKNPKHSFRLVFRSNYGPSKLNFPLFGDDAISDFNTIVLRAGFGNTWVHWSYSERAMAQYLRDRWSKDTHRAMGHYSSHGIYVHLYINGLYWGIYNPSERLDSDFASAYLGGDNSDFDVIKDYTEIVDGNLIAWNRMMVMANSGLASNVAYQYFLGNFPDGTPNPNIKAMVDVESLADYMLLNFYGGNWDWDHHNWVAIRNRVDPGKGFQFFCWDEEHMVETVNANILTENNNNCPSRIFQQLRQNEEFRRLFADRVQKFCFNEGALTPSSAAARWLVRAAEIDKAVIAESARWGDYRRDVHRWQTAPYDLYTKEGYWMPQMDFMVGTYFPGRTDAFISHLRSAGLFPVIDAPEFKINGNSVKGKFVAENDFLTMTSIGGLIYYTTDGTDPVNWKESATISKTAILYTGSIMIRESVRLRARTFANGEWSAANDQNFVIPENYKDIKITEIHYHPLDQDLIDNSEFEFIELKNTGTSTIDIGGLKICGGIEFKVPDYTQLGPKAFLVLASNRRLFKERYGFSPSGEYDGRLENNGEMIVLMSPLNDTLSSVYYKNSDGWPTEPDGSGFSLVPIETDPDGNQNLNELWRASFFIGGSPGADDIKVLNGGKSSDIFTIYQNFPNPFSETTDLPYQLHIAAHVEVDILNMAGQYVMTLENEDKQAGFYRISWKGEDHNSRKNDSGLYFYRITVSCSKGISIMTRKMILTR